MFAVCIADSRRSLQGFVLACVGAESDQLVNICSFAVRYDERWPSTQWHRIYTGSSDVPYVQSGLVGDFIPEPRCSKFVVGVQTRRRKEGVYKRFGRLRPEGSRSKLGGLAVGSVDVDLVSLVLKKSIPLVGGIASPFIDEGDGSYR